VPEQRILAAEHLGVDAAPDISPCNTANTTRNRSSTGTVRPGFCDLLMTAILPGTQPGDPDRKPD